MYIYVLKLADDANPPSYEYYMGFVIATRTEQHAREIAQDKGGIEKGDCGDDSEVNWLSREHASCERVGISLIDEERLILSDYKEP